MPNDLIVCRVCGLAQAEPPWGDDGATPTFDSCDCCGVEFGYEDATLTGVTRYRESWLAGGAEWHNRRLRPPRWDAADQMANVPDKWR